MKHSVPSFIFSLFSFVLILTTCYLILSSCTEPTKPPVDNGPDTTSHNFSWTIDTIGTRNSYLKDVAIINENDIWAVGEIHTDETDRYDSLGVWQPPFNAVHWDGNEWELLRIPAVTNWGAQSRGPMLAVSAFASDDVWIFSQAGSYAYWNGSKWESKYVSERVGSITKIWGTSSQDMYFVGTNGNITHYDGQSWQRLESGTTTDINDIWGTVDAETGHKTILCPVSARFQYEEFRLLAITDTGIVDTLCWSLDKVLMSVWFDQSTPIFVAGSGLFMYKDKSWNEIPDVPMYRTLRVRGSSWNNVFVTGVFGLLLHYNGSTWQEYPELAFENGELNGLSVTDNLIVATGQIGNRGIIITGKKLE